MDRTLCALFALNDGTMENLLELRMMLEAEAFRDIAAYATDEEIERIAEKADYDYLDPSLERQNSNDHGFHLAMIQLSEKYLGEISLHHFICTYKSLYGPCPCCYAKPGRGIYYAAGPYPHSKLPETERCRRCSKGSERASGHYAKIYGDHAGLSRKRNQLN